MYKQLFCFAVLIGLTIFSPGCRKKKANPSWRQLHVEITGLDGNGVAEDNIRQELFALDGVRSISFNYLEDEVVVLYDTTLVSGNKIIDAIGSVNNGKHKILEHHEEQQPEEKKDVETPPDDKEIGDDVDYKDNG